MQPWTGRRKRGRGNDEEPQGVYLKEATAKRGDLLGSSAAAEKLALAAAVVDSHAANGKSKVVIARDATLHGAGAQPDEKRVLNLLDKAMAAYTGREKPVEAWKKIVPANVLDGKVIGLKVNGLGGKGIATHTALTLAIAERLQQAGVKPGNILVWDQKPTSSRPAALRSTPIQAESAAPFRHRRLRRRGVVVGRGAAFASPKSLPASAPWSSTCPSSRTTEWRA